ncbi:MAG: DUF4139 domain-containing protein [Bacteroidales bacterium]|nr:DUF4139 domain-containing protein [Bacteroidales bacterium]
MKKALFLCMLSLLLTSMLKAENETPRTLAKLTEATVYPNGATMTLTANIAVKAGSNDIVIEGLSPYIDRNSLKVSASNGVVIASSEFATDYLKTSTEAKDLASLRDSLNSYKNKQQQLERDIKVQQQLLSMLTNGTSHNMDTKDQTITTADINANMELYRQKAPGILTAVANAEADLTKTKERIKALTNQITQDERKVGQKRSGIVTLALNSPIATNTTFTIQYYTGNASWTPCYDINIKDAKSDVNITAKAKVTQTTGLDWEHVKLTLSNATPSRNIKAPTLYAWMLDYERPMVRTANTIHNSKAAPESDEEEVIMDTYSVNASVASVRSASVAAQQTPLYLVNNVIYNGDISEIDPATIVSIEVMDDNDAHKQFGNRADVGVINITTKTMTDYVQMNESEMNLNYTISLPYTIPGNGKAQTIELKKHTIKADFYYYTAPKLDQQVYMMAKLNNWERLGLLSGEATINYQGTFLGSTFLDTHSTNKDINLSLTQEKQISVKRELNAALSSTKTTGNTTTVTRSYTITVRNQRSSTTNMMVKDQYPVSLRKDIEVKVMTVEPATTTNNAQTGILTWESTLAPGESKNFVVTYVVKYPKDQDIRIE